MLNLETDKNHRTTILVVDDDADILEQSRLNLEAAGYHVVTADSQKEAEEILKAFIPDLAVLDLMMENQDSGFILSHQIKRLDPKLPVIIITAVTNQTGISFNVNTPQEASWIKADAIIQKPIRYEQLLGEVKRLHHE